MARHRRHLRPRPTTEPLVEGLRWGDLWTPALRKLAWLMVPLMIWAYWPTWVHLVGEWQTEADYSHGFLVVPLAIYLLWIRRGDLPERQASPSWLGLAIIGLSLAMRWVAARYYLQSIEGWSLIVWCWGVAWTLGGWGLARWSFPGVAFLAFMVPLPYRVETMLSIPLQRLATRLSCFWLQVLGQPAFGADTTINLPGQRLEVEHDCSGLRIFMGIIALACAYALVSRREWWEGVLLMTASIPVALLANASRIVMTALLYQYGSTEAARRFSHDFAGWLMIVVAAALFSFVLWCMRHALPEMNLMDSREITRRRAQPAS